MRITNNMLQRSALGNLQRNLQHMLAAEQRMNTGLRFQRASEDPGAAAETMRAESSLQALTQYKRNIDTATNRAATEESILGDLTELLTRAQELGLGQATSAGSAATRAATKVEVDELLEHAVRLGNTKFGDAYLFGGSDADTPPLDAAAPGFATTPPTGEPRTEIAAGQYVRATHNADQIFLQPGTLQALKNLSTALAEPDTDLAIAAIRVAVNEITGAFDDVQALVGENGARTNQLQMAAANLDALEVNLKTFKSDLSEVDIEEAMTELVGRQTAYQAALSATSRVLSMNLTDYLR